MARINLVKGGVALGVGGANGYLEKMDNEKGRQGMLKRWSDLAAIIGTIGGAAAQAFNVPYVSSEVAEAVELASASILGKKLSAVVGIGHEAPLGGRVGSRIRLIAAPRISDYVPSNTANAASGYRSI